MNKISSIAFTQKEESIKINEKIVTYPIGTLLLSIMDVEWDDIMQQIDGIIDASNDTNCFTNANIQEYMSDLTKSPFWIASQINNLVSLILKEKSPYLYELFFSQMFTIFSKHNNETLFNDEFVYAPYYNSNINAFVSSDKMNIYSSVSIKVSKNLDMLSLFINEFPLIPKNIYLNSYLENQDEFHCIVSIKFINWIKNNIARLNTLKQKLPHLINSTLEITGIHQQLSSIQRLEKFINDNPNILNQYYNYGRIRLNVNIANTDFPIGYWCDDLTILVIHEFIYMCQNDIELKKCQRCDKYFKPYSSKALYCTRIDNISGKTCRDLEAEKKHYEIYNYDDANKLYRKTSNKYQMRCSRNPEQYKIQDYEHWKTESKKLLNKCKNGDITIEQFKSKMEASLPF